MRGHLKTLMLGSAAVDRGRLLPLAGLRTAVVFGALAIWSYLAGQPERILPLAIGCVFVAFAEAGESVGRRWRTMAWVTLWIMLAAGVGTAFSDFPWLGVPASMLVALIAGVAGVAGQRAAVGGMLSLVTFTIFLGAPQLPEAAVDSALLVGLGGSCITIVTIGPRLIRSPQALRTSLVPVDGLWARIRPRLTSQDAFVRHALRLAALIGVTTVNSEVSGVAHAYWLPMTIAWVTKPDADGTVTRVADRLVGTLVGLATCALLILGGHVHGLAAIAVTILATGVIITFISANYPIGVAAITVLVVVLYSVEGEPVTAAIDVRLIATLLAGMLTIGASYVWRIPPGGVNPTP